MAVEEQGHGGSLGVLATLGRLWWPSGERLTGTEAMCWWKGQGLEWQGDQCPGELVALRVLWRAGGQGV